MGLFSGVSIIIGTVIGSGVFVSPAVILVSLVTIRTESKISQVVVNYFITQTNTVSPGLFLVIWGVCGVISLMGNHNCHLLLMMILQSCTLCCINDTIILMERLSGLCGTGDTDAKIRRRVHLFPGDLQQAAPILGSLATFHLFMGHSIATATGYHLHCCIGFCWILDLADYDQRRPLRWSVSLFRDSADSRIGCL